MEIIAEFGQSHRGSLDLAMAQARAAAAAGAKAAKWQIFDPARLAAPSARRYWDAGLGGSESQRETFKKNGMLTADQWLKLASECHRVGVEFLATPFDLEAVDLLKSLNVARVKIASADITYLPLLDAVRDLGRRVIASVGAATDHEIGTMLERLAPRPVTLLACTLSYPCPADSAGLGRIGHLRSTFDVPVGYSDHTLIVETALAAAAAGATVLERHVTLGGSHVPDDQMALPIADLERYRAMAELGETLRKESRMGQMELASWAQARRGIYAARRIRKGKVVEPADIIGLRPAAGAIPVAEWDTVLGLPATKYHAKGDALSVY